MIEFHPDGPHSREYTHQLAETMAEAVHTLAYATSREKSGLVAPVDVYRVLGLLSGGVANLPQSLEQMAEWMRTEVADGRAVENPTYGPHGGNSEAAATALSEHLRAASQSLKEAHQHLRAAQQDTAGMERNRDLPDLPEEE